MEDKERTESENLRQAAVQCWLAEYESLRNHIVNFQRMQHNLIWVNISAAGIILTAAIYLDMMILLLAMPFVSSLLGLYWVAQGIQTSHIGLYIRDKIAPALQELSLNHEVMGFESHVRTGKTSRLSKNRFFKIFKPLLIPRAAGGLFFVITSFVGLGFTGNELLEPNQWEIKVIWLIALIFTFFLIGIGYWSGHYWHGER